MTRRKEGEKRKSPVAEESRAPEHPPVSWIEFFIPSSTHVFHLSNSEFAVGAASTRISFRGSCLFVSP
jgi:hypothetical protein